MADIRRWCSEPRSQSRSSAELHADYIVLLTDYRKLWSSQKVRCLLIVMVRVYFSPSVQEVCRSYQRMGRTSVKKPGSRVTVLDPACLPPPPRSGGLRHLPKLPPQRYCFLCEIKLNSDFKSFDFGYIRSSQPKDPLCTIH